MLRIERRHELHVGLASLSQAVDASGLHADLTEERDDRSLRGGEGQASHAHAAAVRVFASASCLIGESRGELLRGAAEELDVSIAEHLTVARQRPAQRHVVRAFDERLTAGPTCVVAGDVHAEQGQACEEVPDVAVLRGVRHAAQLHHFSSIAASRRNRWKWREHWDGNELLWS